MASWIHYFMLTFIGLALSFLLLIAVAPLTGMGQSVFSFSRAAPITQRLATNINILHSSPQENSVEVVITPLNCNITFDKSNNYIETKSISSGMFSTKYGMYCFKDVTLHAPDVLQCNGKTKILIKKRPQSIKIEKAGVSP